MTLNVVFPWGWLRVVAEACLSTVSDIGAISWWWACLCVTIAWKMFNIKFLGFVFVAYLDEENHKKVKVDITMIQTQNLPFAYHNCNEANSLTLSFINHI